MKGQREILAMELNITVTDLESSPLEKALPILPISRTFIQN